MKNSDWTANIFYLPLVRLMFTWESFELCPAKRERERDIQRQQVLLALNIWYSAEQWFIDSYEVGTGAPYLFYLTDSPGDGVITVSFLIGQGLSFAGRALNFAYTVPGNAFVRGEIQINLPPDHASNPKTRPFGEQTRIRFRLTRRFLSGSLQLLI